MTNRKIIRFVTGIGVVGCCLLVSAAQAETLKKEPAMGTLREGERVLVDDGSCGPGKIKEVIGGNHVEVGGTKRIKRVRRCIKR
jgi:hypothetical protein